MNTLWYQCVLRGNIPIMPMFYNVQYQTANLMFNLDSIQNKERLVGEGSLTKTEVKKNVHQPGFPFTNI